MEKPLEKLLDEVINAPGVSGVVCADNHGLCLCAKGTAKRETSGLVSSIESQARKIVPDVKENPVILIENDIGSIIIKSHEGVTLGVYKGTG